MLNYCWVLLNKSIIEGIHFIIVDIFVPALIRYMLRFITDHFQAAHVVFPTTIFCGETIANFLPQQVRRILRFPSIYWSWNSLSSNSKSFVL